MAECSGCGVRTLGTAVSAFDAAALRTLTAGAAATEGAGSTRAGGTWPTALLTVASAWSASRPASGCFRASARTVNRCDAHGVQARCLYIHRAHKWHVLEASGVRRTDVHAVLHALGRDWMEDLARAVAGLTIGTTLPGASPARRVYPPSRLLALRPDTVPLGLASCTAR